MEQAAVQGQGAASLDGKMIDVASIKMAKNVVALSKLITAKS
jgi:citrate lyase subunit beta/citryl-CoA lyase